MREIIGSVLLAAVITMAAIFIAALYVIGFTAGLAGHVGCAATWVGHMADRIRQRVYRAIATKKEVS